jgi:2-polyprenyl-3-methyl-5-hydroxy-6-metoxy-1,4-benzoquinol methylase
MSNAPESIKADSSTRSWEQIADDWVAHADTNDYRNLFLFPRTFAMLEQFAGELRGKRALDLGCGEAGYARELARRGAAVVAIDGCARLISVARQRCSAEGLPITCLHGNASHLSDMAEIKPASFDLVLAAMSLMDVEDYSSAIREAHAVLRPGGYLLMSILHPCFTSQVARWQRGPEGELQHFIVDRYFDRATWHELITASFHAPMVRRHRTLQDYTTGALQAGFTLRHLDEPTATDEDVKLSRRFRKLQRIPYFMFLMWQK